MSRKRARERSREPGGRRYPMPCPGCRRIIDARDRLCPHCGIDTDARLAPFRRALPFIAIGLLLLVGLLARAAGCSGG